MTSATSKRYSHSETRKEEHLKLLKRLDNLALADSCCEICHCDCYSSHRSSDLSVECGRLELEDDHEADLDMLNFNRADRAELEALRHYDNNNNNSRTLSGKDNKKRKSAKSRVKKKKSASTLSQPTPTKDGKTTPPTSKSPLLRDSSKKALVKRSKSASSIRSLDQLSDLSAHYTRDCKILQELLTSLETTPQLEIPGKRKAKTPEHTNTSNMTLPPPWPSLCLEPATTSKADGLSLAPLKLCESMANLCLAPTVQEAFQQVPQHDKMILNRMATKRSEKVTAKENAWLARKYWENERYERELFKCEQMEEYKRAVRDKQYQDYLVTKARLNEIAQRDLAELQRLRVSLQQKDERTKRRLDAVRIDRDIQLCQRRCDELRRSEAVNIQQEEQHLDETLRKQEICHRLTDRLQRADQLRSQMLDSYLKRLRHDNYIASLLHEENWRETQQCELDKREQLKEHISRKRTKAQRFVENRQRRNEVITKTAKISASLRELVRSSVTPEGAAALLGGGTASLGRLLIDRPFSKLSIH